MQIRKSALRSLLVLSAALSLSLPALADTPLTSTGFAEAYTDLPLVAEALKTHKLTPEMADFLYNDDNPLNQRLALANAVAASYDGHYNAMPYVEYLQKRLKEPDTAAEKLPLSPSQQVVLGYLIALDSYSAPDYILPMLRSAAARLPKLQSAQVVLALAETQIMMSEPGGWCKLWQHSDKVLHDKSLAADMRQAGLDIIEEYMDLYEEYCQVPAE